MTEPPSQSGDAPRLPTDSLQALRTLLLGPSRHRGAVALVVFTSLIYAITEPILPAMLKPFIDRGFSQEPGFPLWLVPVSIVLLFLVRSIAWFCNLYFANWLAQSALAQLRRAAFDAILRADLALFRRETSSSLTTVISGEANAAVQNVVLLLIGAIRDGLTVVALMSYLLYLNWSLTLMTVLILLPMLEIVRRISKKLRRANRAHQRTNEDVAYAVEEGVLSAPGIRLHNAQRRFMDHFIGLAERSRQAAMKVVVGGNLITPLTHILTSVALAAVVTFALVQSQRTGATAGEFVSFLTALLLMLAPLRHLSEIAQPIVRSLAALDRLGEVLHATREPVQGQPLQAPVRGDIELREVQVRFPSSEHDAVQRVSLRIRPGQRVALVGPSGSGKSTLLRLLPRFFEPTAGSILLDGQDIATLALPSLRAQFALVSQDVVLLNDTIAANVAFRAEEDRARVQACIEAAQLQPLVQRLPDGLDTIVGHNGATLSGGERQRLAIARALYQDAPILLFDEATSALDSESERRVQDALQQLTKGRTAIFVAHRLSTILDADCIYVMDHGRLVEQGTHAELTARGGLYATLVQHQFDLERAESGAPS